jgi:hypothetical protein
MFDEIRSALQDVAGGAEKLRTVLSLPDASTKLLRFVSDDIWGSRGRCRVISRSIAEYLVQAWDVRNSCKHNGAVLPLPSAPEGRVADGVDAMARLGNMMMMIVCELEIARKHEVASPVTGQHMQR